jgi:rhamnulokinase
VVVGRFGAEQLELEEAHRFAIDARRDAHGARRWPALAILDQIQRGLRAAARAGARVTSVGVDAWGSDYGLLDGAGKLLEEPLAMASSAELSEAATDSMQKVFELVPRDVLHLATGIGAAPGNTIFQLHAHVHGGRWPRNVARLLPIADLFHHFLCSSDAAESTGATATQMVAHDARDWDRPRLRKLNVPSSILPRIVDPGTRLGPLKSEVVRDVGIARCEVVAPATLAAASEIAGTPLSPGDAFISSGPSLRVGAELETPLVSFDTLREELTNEGGAAGTTRLLRRFPGLSLLERCRATWREASCDLDWEEPGRDLERAPALAALIDPRDPELARADDLPAALRRQLRLSGQPAPERPAALARILVESLALHCADALATIAALTGRRFTAVRVVGSGSRDDFLNQAIADASGLEVLAGPADAAAIGNLLVQAIAAGRFADLGEARAYVAHRLFARRFGPAADPTRAEKVAALWRAAGRRLARPA